MYDYTKKTYLELGQRVKAEMSYSEACMSLRVAGTVLEIELVRCRNGAMAQLYKDGAAYSFPVTTGEAGVYQDEGGYYHYPPLDPSVQVSSFCEGCAALLDREDHEPNCPMLEERY